MRAEFHLTADDIKAIIAKALPPVGGVNVIPTDVTLDLDERGRVRAVVQKEAAR